MKRRRKMDRVRDCYRQVSVVLMVMLAAFTIYRLVA
jgi:hypothetical protein